MSEAQFKRPRQLTTLAVLWLLFGVWNLWVAFQGIGGDLEIWHMLSNPQVHGWFRMAVPVELGIGIATLVAALVQLLTVPLLLIGKPSSVKLALGVFVSIAILNLVSGALYSSAPPEIRSAGLTSAMLQGFGFGIFQMIVVVFFWRDLNRPEVDSYLRRMEAKDTQERSQSFFKNCVSCGQQIPVASEMCPFCNADQKIVAQSEEKKPDVEPKFFCRFCGSENKRDAAYCESCGKHLKES